MARKTVLVSQPVVDTKTWEWPRLKTELEVTCTEVTLDKLAQELKDERQGRAVPRTCPSSNLYIEGEEGGRGAGKVRMEVN